MANALLTAFFCAATLAATSAAKAEEIAGGVNRDGKSQVTSTKYRLSHPSVGRYVITFKTPFPTPYATCIFMPIGDVAESGLVETTKSCDVSFINSNGNLTNALFNFLAVDTTR